MGVARHDLRERGPHQGPRTPRRTRRVRLLLVGVLGLAMARVLLEPVRVVDGSMAPTLTAQERVVVARLLPGQTPGQGDLVLARAPDGELVVKRLAATAGQVVEVADGRVLVDGAPTASAAQSSADGMYFGPERVPAGAVFLVSDRLNASRDSRLYGPVPLSSVEGTVIAVWWPWDQARRLR